MQRDLPPLTSFWAFEAAGRLGSFTKAAEELGITVGAVSQHVRILEAFAGQRLFLRVGRGVELTKAGLAAHLHASASLDLARYAANAMRARLAPA